jgi:hypothetical protein
MNKNIKVILGAFLSLTLTSTGVMASDLVVLPLSITYYPNDPQLGFSPQVNTHFKISADDTTKTSPVCYTPADPNKHYVTYILTDLLYRGEADHTVYAVYGPEDRGLSWCWVNVQSRSTLVKPTGSGWDQSAMAQWWKNQVYCQFSGGSSSDCQILVNIR